jgi:hypothetical protein
LSPLDCQAHLLVPVGDHPWGVVKARCGHVLPPSTPSQHERPPGNSVPTCPTCAEITRRPLSFPVEWKRSPQDAPGGWPVTPRGYPTITRAMWSRYPVDGRLHLLGAKAVLQLVAQGCAVAYCGTLLTTENLTLRGRGTPCPTCLAIGDAS